MAQPERSAERVARNDATFREANESIKEAADEYGVDTAIPFICECAEETCTAIIRVSASDYEQVRRNPTHFLNAPGHDASAGPHAAVVEHRNGYDVVAKLGEAADLASELDSRSV